MIKRFTKTEMVHETYMHLRFVLSAQNGVRKLTVRTPKLRKEPNLPEEPVMNQNLYE